MDRLDGKTPVPPSKGHLVRRQSSPSLPREVRLGCVAGPHPNSPSCVAFSCHVFLYFCHVFLSSSPLLPLPSIPSTPPAMDWDSWLLNGSSPFTLWVQEASLQYRLAPCTGMQLLSGELFKPNCLPALIPSCSCSSAFLFFFKRTLCSLSPMSLGSAALLAPRAAQQRPQGTPPFPQPDSTPREGQQEPGRSPAPCQPRLAAGERQPEPTLHKSVPPVREEGRGAHEPSLALGKKLEEPRGAWPLPKLGEGSSHLAGWGYGASPRKEEPRGLPAPRGPWEGLG